MWNPILIWWLTIKKNLLAIKQVETTEIVVVVTPAAVVVVADDDEALTKPETSLDDWKMVKNCCYITKKANNQCKFITKTIMFIKKIEKRRLEILNS